MVKILRYLFEVIARLMPGLKADLKKASMLDKPEEFVKKTFMTVSYMTFGAVFSLFLIFAKYSLPMVFLAVIGVILFAVLFFYFMKLPQVKSAKKEKEISKEIVFAARHLLIELESGVPLYNAMINLSKNYEVMGRYFREIVDKVNLGTPIEDALNEAVENVPSNDFRRILWQVLNSLRSGSDIVLSLNIVIEQIVRQQTIEVNKYGRKLNPLSMFYMIIAVIIPSLGITMLIILSSFVDFELNLTILLFISFMLGFVQFMFLSIIKFSRPAIEF